MPANLTDLPSSIDTTDDLETHDQWFARQVDRGLREADDPATTWVTNEQVFREVDARLQRLQDQAHLRKAS